LKPELTLLEKFGVVVQRSHEVHGIKRRASLFNTDRIDHLYQDPHVENRNFILHYGDLTDATNLIRIIKELFKNKLYFLIPMYYNWGHDCNQPNAFSI
jgi:GDPmannose 4,6-dehydratase